MVSSSLGTISSDKLELERTPRNSRQFFVFSPKLKAKITQNNAIEPWPEPWSSFSKIGLWVSPSLGSLHLYKPEGLH